MKSRMMIWEFKSIKSESLSHFLGGTIYNFFYNASSILRNKWKLNGMIWIFCIIIYANFSDIFFLFHPESERYLYHPSNLAGEWGGCDCRTTIHWEQRTTSSWCQRMDEKHSWTLLHCCCANCHSCLCCSLHSTWRPKSKHGLSTSQEQTVFYSLCASWCTFTRMFFDISYHISFNPHIFLSVKWLPALTS